jgi:hypothetical protein
MRRSRWRLGLCAIVTFAFTYTAGDCGASAGDMAGDMAAVTVPPGWTPPSNQSGTPGFVTWAGSPPVSVSGSMIMVPAGSLEPGTTVSSGYEAAQVPCSAGAYTFAAGLSGADGLLQQLASSAVVMVTPAEVAPPPAGGAGTMTVTPARVTASRPSTLRFTYTAAQAALSSSGEIAVQVPAGWAAPSIGPGQTGYASVDRGVLTVSGRRIAVTAVTLRRGQQLTITYSAGIAPAAAGVTTFVTSQRPNGTSALANVSMSPTVTVVLPIQTPGQPTSWLPILLVVIGLVLVAATAALVALRPLRRGR